MAKTYTSPPTMQLAKDVRYGALLSTSEGDIRLELLPERAPVTVNNFVTLAKDGYFDGITFHRIVQGFVLQTGDPTGTGGGGPGYRFADELPPQLPYGPGVVAMANAGPNTNGSQFFICSGAQAAGLNNHPNYTVFGRVVEGMDVVEKIDRTPVERSSSGEFSKPQAEVILSSVEITEEKV